MIWYQYLNLSQIQGVFFFNWPQLQYGNYLNLSIFQLQTEENILKTTESILKKELQFLQSKPSIRPSHRLTARNWGFGSPWHGGGGTCTLLTMLHFHISCGCKSRSMYEWLFCIFFISVNVIKHLVWAMSVRVFYSLHSSLTRQVKSGNDYRFLGTPSLIKSRNNAEVTWNIYWYLIIEYPNNGILVGISRRGDRNTCYWIQWSTNLTFRSAYI